MNRQVDSRLYPGPCHSAQYVCSRTRLDATLNDQTQVDSKPAGQPEHASLNHSQLIAANRPKLVLWAPPAGGGDKVPL